jgi:hypothetical protein
MNEQPVTTNPNQAVEGSVAADLIERAPEMEVREFAALVLAELIELDNAVAALQHAVRRMLRADARYRRMHSDYRGFCVLGPDALILHYRKRESWAGQVHWRWQKRVQALLADSKEKG